MSKTTSNIFKFMLFKVYKWTTLQKNSVYKIILSKIHLKRALHALLEKRALHYA